MVTGMTPRFVVALLLSFATIQIAPRAQGAQAAKPEPGAPKPDEWPQFRGNPALTGISASVPPQQLKLLWSYEAGDAIESSAAIADGRVFVGVGSGHLIAVGLQDGKLLWKYAVDQGVG